MSLHMGFTKKLELRTEKVKSVDIHPSEPWVASAMYNGSLTIYNYNTQALVKKLEISDAPLRCCKFVPRKQWIVAAGDKMCISVYNYNSLEKVHVVEAHKDYVRYLDLHSTMPYVLSCSDDMTTVLWDIDKGWEKLAVFEGHSHYVMMAKWSPKDPNTFATCSLDKTISFWRVMLNSTNATLAPNATNTPNTTAAPVTSSANTFVGNLSSGKSKGSKGKSGNKPHFTLTGHERGVNCIDFCPNSSFPYIISGSDDCTIRVWDYQTKLCLQVLKKHFKPVSCVVYHPRLPIILSTGEDGDFNVWNSNLYKIKRSVNYGYGQLWHVASNTTDTALASDSGVCVLELAGGKPLASMYSSKLVMVKSSDILTCNLTSSLTDLSNHDPSKPLNLSFRNIGSSEFFPQELSHHPNGRFICLCGDSEYIIYTSQGMKSKTFGKASQFVWSFEGDYATYDGFEVSVFSEFTLREKLDLQQTQVQKLHGGKLLGVSTDVDILFYTWPPCMPVKRFSLQVDDIYWHPSSNRLALASQLATYILSYNLEPPNSSRSSKFGGNYAEDLDENEAEELEEEIFQFEKELVERVTSALWVNDTFLFVTSNSHLSMYLAGNTETLVYLDKQLHLVGYLPESQLVYLCDDSVSVYGYQLPFSYLQFHSKLYHYTQVLNSVSKDEHSEFEDEELSIAKNELKQSLENVDEKMRENASRFLQLFGEYELGLLCTDNPDLKFELHLKLGNVNDCLKLLLWESLNLPELSDYTVNNDVINSSDDVDVILGLDDMLKRKWKRLGDYCLKSSQIKVAKLSYKFSNNLQNLLVLHTLTGDLEGVKYVANTALLSRVYNVAFTAFYMLNDIDSCIQILHTVNRHAEATFMARTYRPNLLKNSFTKWSDNLKNKNVQLMEPFVDNNEVDLSDFNSEFPEASQYLKFKDSFFSAFAKQNEQKNDTVDL
ncbi:beta subunit of coatomer complex, putative [Theileria annulata]|uniref:Coatomer subunit beta' n=1 Tax=Theileria annulata TaxID=5874 RepID=Q4UGX0_THEAN|nr:beta subunit of coatomer complex, putative [Theileria annulata]CAI73669.1 beta subunit of coatomer complex, putative [Theileria annulata]|eukprot:XP_954346.1 beta subunit of coatomer complex, putative [Theileria annulata]